VDQLHSHDSHQNVTETQVTGYHTKVIYSLHNVQHVRPSQSILHTGWSSTCCKSYGDGMDDWKHLL